MRTATPSPPLGLGVAVAMLAGVTVAQVFAWLPPAAASGALLLLAVACHVLARGRARLVAALVAGIAWACLAGGWRMQQRLPEALAGTDVALTGRVVGLPQRGEGGLRFDLQVEQSRLPALRGGIVRLGWYGRAPPIAPGSRWQLIARLKPPRGTLDPGGGDIEKRSLAQGIVATGSVREPRSALALSAGGGVDAWRDAVSARIARALPAGRGRFVQALAVGDTRGLDDRDWERLRATGLTHQIAISGFHVGMVAGFGALLARALFAFLPGLIMLLPGPVPRLPFALTFLPLAFALLTLAFTLLLLPRDFLCALIRPAHRVAIARIGV